MSRNPAACGPNMEPIHLAGRRLSSETIMFHQSVADRLGLNVTDHKCLDFLLLHGPSTAGDLSERTALTTGAITAVIDRLEKAGYVRREADPNDRRRVIVHPIYERLGEIGMLFSDLSTRINALSSQYTTTQLAIIIDFMNRSCDILHEAALTLRKETAEKSAPQSRQKEVASSRKPTKATQRPSRKSNSPRRRANEAP